MFSTDSFDGLKDASEVKSAVSYFAHNETKFRQQLASEGLNYEAIGKQIATIWKSLLDKCSEFKYSDYIVEAKKSLYGSKNSRRHRL